MKLDSQICSISQSSLVWCGWVGFGMVESGFVFLVVFGIDEFRLVRLS